MTALEWKYNDGGRAAAGYRGDSGDCTCRAIAIATEQSYQAVYDLLNEAAKRERRGRRSRAAASSARTGVKKATIRYLMAKLGWQWKATMGVGTGCQVHLRQGELPKGRLIVAVSRHMTAVIDGVIQDTYDPSREGTRCVYGYYYKAEHIDSISVERDARRGELLDWMSRLRYEAEIDSGDVDEALWKDLNSLVTKFEKLWKIKATEGYHVPSFES